LQMLLYIGRHFWIQHVRHDLWHHIDYSHRNPSHLKVLRNLKADKSASHHNRTFHPMLLHIRPHCISILRSPHLEYSRKPHSRHIRNNRRCTDRKNQIVVGIYFFLAVCQIPRLYIFCFCIQMESLSPSQDAHSGESFKFLRCIDNQLLFCLDQSSYIIRKTTACIGNITTFCYQYHLCAAVFSFQFCRCLSTGCDSSDHECSHFFFLLLINVISYIVISIIYRIFARDLL